MDISLFLTILGTIATLLFGFLSIDLFKRKKYPGKIIFIEMNSLSLFNNLVKNFEEITILHNNQPIKENIFYIKGAFANVGDVDIDKSMIEKNITIEAPKNYAWLKCKITNSSKELYCESTIQNGKILEFKIGLFKKNEFFEFEALVDSQDPNHKKNISNDLKFSHRISNTQKIQKSSFVSASDIKKQKQPLIVISVMLLLVLAIALLVPLFKHPNGYFAEMKKALLGFSPLSLFLLMALLQFYNLRKSKKINAIFENRE